MNTVLVVIHVITCIFLIGVVLVNVSKGSEVGAVFSGGQAIFGGAGPGTFLNKVTTVLAVVFFVTSLLLTYLSAKKTSSLMEEVPAVEETIPAPTAPPVPNAVPTPEKNTAPNTSGTPSPPEAASTPSAEQK